MTNTIDLSIRETLSTMSSAALLSLAARAYRAGWLAMLPLVRAEFGRRKAAR